MLLCQQQQQQQQQHTHTLIYTCVGMVAQQIMVQLLVFQPTVQTVALGCVVGGGAFTSAWEIIMKINLHFKLQALAKISLARVSPTE